MLVLVPSLNPDGVTIVSRWYNHTLGTAAEGSDPPELYHHYTGHDNNRDWYAFTQVETRLTVDSLHNVWHPQIVHDIHQQGRTGSRLFLPPYLDPIEPNVDPLLVDGVNELGSAMAWELGGQGKTGISINAIYDAWTPSRAYSHYHGGVRILSEAASADLATPVHIPPDQLQAQARGFNPRERSWNFTNPWPGGRWSLRATAIAGCRIFSPLERTRSTDGTTGPTPTGFPKGRTRSPPPPCSGSCTADWWRFEPIRSLFQLGVASGFRPAAGWSCCGSRMRPSPRRYSSHNDTPIGGSIPAAHPSALTTSRLIRCRYCWA